jgi:hypothetical protein
MLVLAAVIVLTSSTESDDTAAAMPSDCRRVEAPTQTDPLTSLRVAADTEPAPAPSVRSRSPARAPRTGLIHLHGRVVDLERKPFERFGLRLVRLTSSGRTRDTLVRDIELHPNGEFDLTLERGGWRVEPFAPRHQPLQARNFWTSDPERLEYVLLERARVTGVVRGEDGAPLRFGIVDARGGDSGLTDADGRYEIDLGAGSASLRARKRGFRSSEWIQLAVDLDRPPAPIDFVLQRAPPDEVEENAGPRARLASVDAR